MTHTVDTLMAMAYKIRDALTYEWDVSEAIEAGNTLRTALTEALQKRDESIDYLTRQCEKYAGQAAQLGALPSEISQEAADAIAAMMKEYNYPCNPANAARAAWRAARLYTVAQPVREPCKTLCELCVKRGYIGCANTSQTTPIVVAQPKGLFVDMIAAQGPEFVAEMAKICVQHDCDECKARAAQPIKPIAQRVQDLVERLGGIEYLESRSAQSVREPDLSSLSPKAQSRIREWITNGTFVERAISTMREQERELMEYEKVSQYTDIVSTGGIDPRNLAQQVQASTDFHIFSITTAYEQGVGKGHQAFKRGNDIENPYTVPSDCAKAWDFGYEEGKIQASRLGDKT